MYKALVLYMHAHVHVADLVQPDGLSDRQLEFDPVVQGAHINTLPHTLHTTQYRLPMNFAPWAGDDVL